MQFTRTRGRPKSNRPSKDLGTPELIHKRAHGLTEEPLDSCHKRGLISDADHWSGLHYRWLYTLRYGTPDPTAIRWDIAEFGQIASQDDPNWREAREAELHEAGELLRSQGAYQPVLNLTVHNRYPLFLSPAIAEQSYSQSGQALTARLNQELETIQQGLQLLSKHWKRKNS